MTYNIINLALKRFMISAEVSVRVTTGLSDATCDSQHFKSALRWVFLDCHEFMDFCRETKSNQLKWRFLNK